MCLHYGSWACLCTEASCSRSSSRSSHNIDLVLALTWIMFMAVAACAYTDTKHGSQIATLCAAVSATLLAAEVQGVMQQAATAAVVAALCYRPVHMPGHITHLLLGIQPPAAGRKQLWVGSSQSSSQQQQAQQEAAN